MGSSRGTVLRSCLLAVLAAAGCGEPAGPSSESEDRVAPAATSRPDDAGAVVTTGAAPVTVGGLVVTPGGLDFGTILPKASLRGRFVLRNTGAEPIRIVSARPTCLCTVPEIIDGTVIAPGSSLAFNTEFHAPAAPGEKTAKINIVFEEGGEQRHAPVELSADVSLAVRGEPSYIDALRGARSGVVTISSTDGRPFRILSSNGAPPALGDGNPRDAWELHWSLNYPWPGEDCRGDERLVWVVETDHPDCPILPLRIRHDCTGSRSDPTRRERGWFFKDAVANLGAVRGGETVEAEVELGAYRPADVAITGAVSQSPDATAELVSWDADPNGTVKVHVRVTPRRGYEGMLYAMVDIESATGNKAIAFVAKVE